MWKLILFAFAIVSFNLCALHNVDINKGSKIEIDSVAQKELGHLFFFDKRLSYNNALSCSSCHDPILAFTDGYKVSFNSYAEELQRNSPSLLNINTRNSFNWANSKITTLQQQMQRPLFGNHPKELFLTGNENNVLDRFKKDKLYLNLFQKCYKQAIQTIELSEIIECITSYINSLQSRNSKYDQFLLNKDSSLLNKDEWIGFRLFHSDSISCNSCHGGQDFFTPERGGEFANIGLYNCNQSYPESDLGLQSEDNDVDYNGVFRIPGLRNVILTSPYYHDGSEEDLNKVLLNYERQGRQVTYGNCIGDGSQHPLTDGRMQKFKLHDSERKAIISFLNCLTDTSYFQNPYFRNPFE
ncbi:MAG: cytochrome c peroxidase [Saprospiraceae bacterium]